MDTRFTRRQFGKVTLLAMATGSSVFPGLEPPRDEDYLAIGTRGEAESLIADGWEAAGSLADGTCAGGLFCSLRKGRENIIMASDPDFLLAWIDAHDECVANPPPDRDGRVRVFMKHLYGEGR